MTRSASRTLAILVLGAAISSSVLAAPTSLQPLPAMSVSPVPTGAQSLYPRSVGQTSEVTTFQRRQEGTRVNLKSPLQADGDLTIDDPKHDLEGKDGRDSPDNTRSAVPIHLDRRDRSTELTKQHIWDVKVEWEHKSDAEIQRQFDEIEATIREYETRRTEVGKVLRNWQPEKGATTEQTDRARDKLEHDVYTKRRELAEELERIIYSLCDKMIGVCSQHRRSTLPQEGSPWRSRVESDLENLSGLLKWIMDYHIPDVDPSRDKKELAYYKELKQVFYSPLFVSAQDNQKKGGCCTIL
ncbi:hypothetical protein EV361DRAFT_948408 [Lentinula raphanica]|nr:hypothetical protein EV361DRAFT_948408 [Lentinula raphanica]